MGQFYSNDITLTDLTLKEKHDSLMSCYDNDRGLTNDQKKKAQERVLSKYKYYGADEFFDWNISVENVETELLERGIPFTKIPSSKIKYRIDRFGIISCYTE